MNDAGCNGFSSFWPWPHKPICFSAMDGGGQAPPKYYFTFFFSSSSSSCWKMNCNSSYIGKTSSSPIGFSQVGSHHRNNSTVFSHFVSFIFFFFFFLSNASGIHWCGGGLFCWHLHPWRIFPADRVRNDWILYRRLSLIGVFFLFYLVSLMTL